jgi:hypothetical protein
MSEFSKSGEPGGWRQAAGDSRGLNSQSCEAVDGKSRELLGGRFLRFNFSGVCAEKLETMQFHCHTLACLGFSGLCDFSSFPEMSASTSFSGCPDTIR